jgi:hypothetical protein
MKDHKNMTRRRAFLSGVAASVAIAPLAEGSTPPSTGQPGMLEDVPAIRGLFRAYAASLPGEGEAMPVRLLQDPTEAEDSIVVSADRRTAHARFHCLVKMVTPLVGDAPLLEMARQQGCADTRWESGFLELECLRNDDGWQIQRLIYRRESSDQHE